MINNLCHKQLITAIVKKLVNLKEDIRNWARRRSDTGIKWVLQQQKSSEKNQINSGSRKHNNWAEKNSSVNKVEVRVSSFKLQPLKHTQRTKRKSEKA